MVHFILSEDLGARSKLLWDCVSSMWGPPTQGNTHSLSQWFKMKEWKNQRISDGSMEEGKSLHEIYKKDATLFIWHLWHIEFLLSCSSCLVRSHCCLARVFQAENSPFIRGTSSATLERFIHNLLAMIFTVVSSICIQCLQVVHISRGRSRRNWVVILTFVRGDFAGRNSEREDLLIFCHLVDFFGWGRELSFSGDFTLPRLVQKEEIGHTWEWRLSHIGWSVLGEIWKVLVEVISTFPKRLRRILLVYWQAVCFSSFGGHRAFWGSILEVQNSVKPFLDFSGICERSL